jgi:hypothetical protein
MDEKPARAWLWYIVGMVALIGVALIMLGSGTARAQEMLCADADIFIRQIAELKKQRLVWEGTIPPPNNQPPAQVLIVQSDKGEWSHFLISEGRACLMFVGTDANPPIVTDKGA